MAELAVPSIDFSPLGELPKVYKAAQNEQKLAELGKGLASGTINYRTAAGSAAEMGDINSVYKFLTLAEAEKKRLAETAAGKSFSESMAPYFGGGNTSAPVSAPPTAAPIAAPAAVAPGAVQEPLPLNTRAPVASSATVVGDDEGVRDGIYEPQPGQRGPAQPQPQALAALGMPTQSAGRPAAPVDSRSPPPQVMAQNGPQSAAPGSSGMQLPPASVLIGAMANPNMPTAQREIAGKLLTRVLDEAKPDEKVRHLQELARASGFTGTPLELEERLRRASKTNITTNIDSKTETEENKAAGKAAGERRATMFAAAGAASKTLVNLNRTESLLNQVSQGKLSPANMTVSAWAKALGVNDDVATSLGLDPKGVGSAQALQALANESVLSKIGAGGFPANNFSNSDREFLVDMFPRLGNDPRGNAIMVEGARRMAKLDLQRAKDYQAFKANPENKGKGFEDFELDWSEKIAKQDLFGDLRKQAEQIVGAPRSDIGGTLSNPGPAPQQQPRQQQPQPQGKTTTRQGVNWSVQ